MATKHPLANYSGDTKEIQSGDSVPVTDGGTGLTSCTTGDLLLGSGASTLAALAIGASNTVLTSNGTTASWAVPANVGKLIVGSQTNDNAGSVVIGAPVYSTAADHFDKAKANALSTSRVYGLVADTSISTTSAGNVCVGGILSATTAQWDAITGQTGGLTFNSKYYLDASTAGKLTTTAPSASTNIVVSVGLAISTTEMRLTLDAPLIVLR